jgi:DNA-binding response OmpR family regulator
VRRPSERPDLILMDIQLPASTATRRRGRSRRTRAVAAIPIIAVTSYALSGDDKKAHAAGCDAYVAKPFSPRQLLATIRRFLLGSVGHGPCATPPHPDRRRQPGQSRDPGRAPRRHHGYEIVHRRRRRALQVAPAQRSPI